MMTKKLQAIYGLKWPPFATDVPDESLWVTPALETFARRVEQQVSQGGFALITGDPGTGKSASLRWLAQSNQQQPGRPGR
jgi:ABC-type transport system involved in cytochrome c biogenesis ATPase subunit